MIKSIVLLALFALVAFVATSVVSGQYYVGSSYGSPYVPSAYHYGYSPYATAYGYPYAYYKK